MEINIENMIYKIRNVPVMLDSDLAKLYQCRNGTKEINQAVKNNPSKFPLKYSWKLTDDEQLNLRSKILTANNNMSRTNSRVFTEYGVIMLATILKSEIAIEMSIKIIDAFVSMKKYISNNLIEQRYINNQVMKNTEVLYKHDIEIKLLQESFDKLEERRKDNEIYFDGQIYDSYSKILDIFSESKKELIIIDSYADKVLLDIISRLKVDVVIITKENSLLNSLDIKKYNMQYNNLKVIYNNTFHDRFFIIDAKTIYHCGTSINSIGKKTFAINLVTEIEVIKLLLNKIDKMKKDMH